MLLIALGLLGACSTTRPWVNQPLALSAQLRVRIAMTRMWTDAVNRHGGDATLVHLPEIGIRGNTHFPFSDLNTQQIADLMSGFLAKKRLD